MPLISPEEQQLLGLSEVHMGKELIVPIAVLAVLASMLVPVPPVVMDFLLVGNLILALVLFLSTLHISDTLKLSALPSILLLATLYRLALNISTTRNILSAGDGGRVVEAFGTVVIQGNLVVGVVVFLIITLVQFIVIAKGSERVAEVSARFTLDALPGKQMSIDADVRAGLLDMAAARGKRQDLQTESRFYGALDGAMKFVKGDAVAGIIITAINIVGGLAIGILGEGLALQQALSKYTILTVGDGLVAQIPALLNSLAAGIIVTRVARGDDASLAGELLAQIGQVRRVKALSAGLCALLACIPGMPALPFIALGIVLAASTIISPGEGRPSAEDHQQLFTPRPPALLRVELDPARFATLTIQNGLKTAIEAVRESIYQRCGLILPFPEIAPNTALAATFALVLRGVPLEQVTCGESVNALVEQIAGAVGNAYSQHLVECIDDVLTRRTLDTYESVAPELVAAVVPGVVTVTQLTEILKSLVSEGISVRAFDVILQSVAEHGPKAGTERVLLEEVRIALRRTVSYAITPKDGSPVRVVVLSPVIDLQLSKNERERSPVDLSLIDCIVAYEKECPGDWILLTSRSARRLVKEFLTRKGLGRVVVATEELVPELRFELRGEISLNPDTDGQRVLDRLAA